MTKGFSPPAVATLRGVGPATEQRLHNLGISTVADLLFHLPHRYQDRTRLTPMSALQAGEEVLVAGEIVESRVQFGRRRSLFSRVDDGTASLGVRLFHFSRAQQEALAKGLTVQCFGEVREGPRGFEMVHPEYRVVDDGDNISLDRALTPVYPAADGLNQGVLRRLAAQALTWLRDGGGLREHLPPDLLAHLALPSLREALAVLHAPPPGTTIATFRDADYPPRKRIVFEELLAHHLALRALRRQHERESAPALGTPGRLSRELQAALPFELTTAQHRAVAQVHADLTRAHPMHRLLQGDVGSGKTVVAACAAAQAVEAGYQAAVMAPTELLAAQHHATFERWFADLGVRVGWLTGNLNAATRKAALTDIRDHRVNVVVGTHALFQDEVTFARLALVVVDEQHRFGVAQRLALRDKGAQGTGRPHQLIMTATPIPRTLAMVAYADLDTSSIDELPPGRQAVETAVVSQARRGVVVDRVRAACARGQQVYWVCTQIEESESAQCQAAEDTAVRLTAALTELRVGLVHGRLGSAEKDAMMRAFEAGDVDVLVATTVIEVGVDVPNASLMVIENAERLGLSQLHQLRGRVGRGEARSVCVMIYAGPLSATARERLDVLRQTDDGFVIAERDLALRGPGELLGTRQTGMPALRIADLARDANLLPGVEHAATALLEQHAEHVPPLVERWVGGDMQFRDA